GSPSRRSSGLGTSDRAVYRTTVVRNLHRCLEPWLRASPHVHETPRGPGRWRWLRYLRRRQRERRRPVNRLSDYGVSILARWTRRSSASHARKAAAAAAAISASIAKNAAWLIAVHSVPT